MMQNMYYTTLLNFFCKMAAIIERQQKLDHTTPGLGMASQQKFNGLRVQTCFMYIYAIVPLNIKYLIESLQLY